MEARRVYLKVAILLRAKTETVKGVFLHSKLTERLKADVIESEHLLNVSLAHMISVCSMFAHPQADIEKGNAQLTQMYYNALANLPYLTGGKTGTDMIEEERDKAIKAWREMKAKAYKDKKV